jgi:hypothetical protein
MTEEYQLEDGILSLIKFPDPSKVRIVIDDKFVRLYVGPRDWQFDRKTKKCVGAGTALCGN